MVEKKAFLCELARKIAIIRRDDVDSVPCFLEGFEDRQAEVIHTKAAIGEES